MPITVLENTTPLSLSSWESDGGYGVDNKTKLRLYMRGDWQGWFDVNDMKVYECVERATYHCVKKRVKKDYKIELLADNKVKIVGIDGYIVLEFLFSKLKLY